MNKQEYKNWIVNRSIERTCADSEKGDAELGFDYAVSLFVARDAKIREDLEEMKDIMAGFKDCPAVEEMNSLIAKWLFRLGGV